MDRQKLPWVIGLLLIGLIALGISFWLNKKQRLAQTSLFQVAGAEHLTGNIWIFSPGLEKKRRLLKTDGLLNLESIETEDTGEARLSFDNGGSVRVQPDSLILVERTEMTDTYQDAVIIQRGDILVEDAGKTEELFISRNGRLVPAKTYHSNPLSKEPLAQPRFSDSSSASDSGLSEDEITSIITAQRGNFMKCYTALLQRSPEAKGDLSLNFTIENSGKVGLIDVQSAELKDEDFKKCLTSVLSRVQFRAYPGSAISTFFPLKFE